MFNKGKQSNNPHAVIDMLAMWLVPQHCINGLAEALNAIGQIEFFYSEFPRNMSSIAGHSYYQVLYLALWIVSQKERREGVGFVVILTITRVTLKNIIGSLP